MMTTICIYYCISFSFIWSLNNIYYILYDCMISFIIELLAQISSLACDGHWLTLLCLKAAVKEVVLVVLCVPLYSSGEMVQHRLWRRRNKKKPGLLVRVRKLCEYEMRNSLSCHCRRSRVEFQFQGWRIWKPCQIRSVKSNIFISEVMEGVSHLWYCASTI